jgi:hypothetical protein
VFASLPTSSWRSGRRHARAANRRAYAVIADGEVLPQALSPNAQASQPLPTPHQPMINTVWHARIHAQKATLRKQRAIVSAGGAEILDVARWRRRAPGAGLKPLLTAQPLVQAG